MSTQTGIEWTEMTWNSVVGCSTWQASSHSKASGYTSDEKAKA